MFEPKFERFGPSRTASDVYTFSYSGSVFLFFDNCLINNVNFDNVQRTYDYRGINTKY